MKPLQMAVIGVGALGRHHARILSEHPDVELVAVVDSHAIRGLEVAQKTGARWMPTCDGLFEQVDAVSIVVPTVAHLNVAGEFLKRQIPVLVEKPLAATVEQATKLHRLAVQAAVPLQVGHIERFNPAWKAAAPYCRDPKYIRIERVSPYTFRSTDIGVVHDLMIHDIDLVQSLVDAPLKSVEAFGIGVMGRHEDAAQARLTFKNGCIADLTASRIHPTAARTVQVWSAAGNVSIDLNQRTVQVFRVGESLRQGLKPVELASQPGADIEALKKAVHTEWLTPLSVPVTPFDALSAELDHFVHCVQTGEVPLVSGLEGLAAMETAARVLESIATHQWSGTPLGPVGPYPTLTAPSLRRAA